ncbi:PIF1-like helicase, partial [Phytophthora infestans]
NNVSGERFLSDHGQATTHSLHIRKFPAVATLIGKRLPDARSDNVEFEAQLTLQQSLLVLFKPFRRRGDFPKRNLSDFYVKWWRDKAPEIARQFLQNSNDYYTSRELARKRSDANMELFRAMVDGDDYSDDGSNYGASEQAEEAICVDGSILEIQYSTRTHQVSVCFQLNRKQHKMFARAGSRLLQSLTAASYDNVDQMIGFLGGFPGTGKSLVIKALQALAKSWESSDAVETVAYQGVAAKAANGQTIHKLFQWGINTNMTSKRYSIQQRERFARLKMLIMDETSTTDVKFIGMMDQALRDLKQKPDVFFGGIHLQQLPVAGVPAFVDHPPQPTSNPTSRNNTTTYFARIRGIRAYQQINEVVFLEENMRHRVDPKWAEILERWRYGNYTEDDIDYVNNQCYNDNWKSSAMDTKLFCPIIVTSNTLRCEFNDQSAECFSCRQSKTLHQYPAIISKSRFQISRSQQSSLKNIRDDKTGNMAIVLNLAVGMPVQCTINVSRALELANGTIGHLINIQPDQHDTTRLTTRKIKIDVCVFTRNPRHRLYSTTEYDKSRSIVDGLAPGIVPYKHVKNLGSPLLYQTVHLPLKCFKHQLFQHFRLRQKGVKVSPFRS